MKKQSEFTFNGFEPANTTPVPDVLFDELLSELTGAELKVLLYIIRRTSGFKKPTDAISLSQFQKGITTKEGKLLDKGCGIEDRQTIINALASLEKKNCIYGERSKTVKGDNATTVYRICFRDVVGKTYQGSMEKPTTLVEKTHYRSMEKPTTVVGDSNPQETVIQSNSLQETGKQEGTYSDDTVSAATGAFAPSPAPSSQDEPYQPDFSASQAPAIRELSPVLDEAIEHVDEQRAALATAQDSVAHENDNRSQLSTLTVEKPRGQSAKVAPKQPTSQAVAPGKRYIPRTAQVIQKAQLTLLGGQVREWYETIRASRLRMTQANIKALNDLGELDGMDFVSLKETIELIEEQNLVKTKNIPIDPQALASEEGYWRFDKWYQVVVRNRNRAQQQASKPKTNTVTVPRDPGTVEWWDQQTGIKRLMTYAEADENGWNGGFGEFIQHEYPTRGAHV